MTAPLVLDVTPRLAGHLATAIRVHLQWIDRASVPAPAGLADLADLFTSRATQGQAGTQLDDLADLVESCSVAKKLLTYRQAAHTLNCSERHVKRLIAQGELPSVHLGGARSNPHR